ncbi:MAG: ABC transporter ATP-binding protein [Candidatus Thiodiazotropha sp. LLP2]
MTFIQLENISCVYNGVISALADVSLSIPEGETVALLGPSGSGKSTLLNLIAGYEIATSGVLKIAGKSIAEWNRDTFRRELIGFLFQQFHLLDHLSAVRNVELALFPTCKDANQRHFKSSRLLKEVGLLNRLNVQTKYLSGGERQRVAFCRSIVNKPRLLLADEPTGNLDSASSETLLKTLSEYILSHQGTMIVATHDIEVAKICSRVIYLEDGKAVSQ